VERISGGGWRLGVHIADVAAYVKPGSALDREAYKRGNSVYLPDRVIPMLPERLSNGVCSLNPDVNRLTHSVFLEFGKDGRTKAARFGRTVIRSAKRLTYRQAYAILKAPPNDQLGERLHVAWELASLLRRNRFRDGSLDLDFPEVKVRLDEEGKPIQLERIENDESHQLVEEFMLAANEAVARELKNKMIPTVYRVHEDPDPQRLIEYRESILSYGYKVGDVTNRKELQRLLASLTGKPEEQALKIGLLKSLKRARYAPQPLADRHGADRRHRRAHLRYRTSRRRRRDGRSEDEETGVLPTPTRCARPPGLSRDGARGEKLRVTRGTAGRPPHRPRPRFVAQRRFLFL
jgi:ribonuclease R